MNRNTLLFMLFVPFLLFGQGENEATTVAICNSVLSYPADLTQLKDVAQKGGNLNCSCKVHQITSFLSEGQPFIRLFSSKIPTYDLQSTYGENSILETLELTPLQIALAREDLGLIRLLTQHTFSLNQRMKDGLLPLEYALHHNKKELLQYLIKTGANPRIVTIGCPYNIELAQLLLSYGAEHQTIDVECAINQPKKLQALLNLIPTYANKQLNHYQALTLFRNPSLMRILIQKNLNLNQILKPTKTLGSAQRQSLLHFALEIGADEVIDLLLQNRVNLNTTDENGYSPLFYAILFNRNHWVAPLLQKGAAVNLLSSNQRESALSLALSFTNTDLIKTLLEAGADPLLPLSGKKNPLYFSIQNGKKEAAKLLLEYVETEIDILDFFGKKDLFAHPDKLATALSLGLKDTSGELLKEAIQSNRKDIVEVLLQSNQFNWKAEVKNSPLYQAIEQNNTVIALQLINAGADVNEVIPNKEPLLHQIIEQDNLVLCHHLLEKGANPSQLDLAGNPPLYRAIQKKNKEIIKLLLLKENVTLDCNALQLGIEADRLSILHLLEQFGLKYDCEIEGFTPVQYARKVGVSLTIQFFLADKS